MKLKPEVTVAESAATQLDGFIDKFDPKMAKFIREVRAALRKRFPTAIELVYDNYNFFVIGYCSTPRASDCLVSLVAHAKGVGICFYYGAKLPDPSKILQGSGNQVRSIRLSSAKDILKPEVEALFVAANETAKVPLPVTGKGKLVIQSISAKQRPRRVPTKST